MIKNDLALMTNQLDIILKSDWVLHEEEGQITKIFKFANFSHAMQWMTSLIEDIETLDHHPEWCNIYNRVEVILTTHDNDGLTHKDTQLALKMEDAYARISN